MPNAVAIPPPMFPRTMRTGLYPASYKDFYPLEGGTKNRLAVVFFPELLQVVCTYHQPFEAVLDPFMWLILTSI